MRQQEPATQTMTTSEVRQHWSEIVTRVSRRETRVVVEESGIPVAAVISATDLERLDRLDAERAERFRVITEIRARNAHFNPDEVERDVAEEIAAMRAERQARETATPQV